jgi:hypothetical protein
MLKKKRLSKARESMTLPDERYSAIKNTMEFLIRLSAGEYPRVPRGVQEEARSLLRHYPGTFDLDALERAAPEIIQQRMEPLHRMIAAYEDLTPEHDRGDGGSN